MRSRNFFDDAGTTSLTERNAIDDKTEIIFGNKAFAETVSASAFSFATAHQSMQLKENVGTNIKHMHKETSVTFQST